jgi:hypothetical protein
MDLEAFIWMLFTAKIQYFLVSFSHNHTYCLLLFMWVSGMLTNQFSDQERIAHPLSMLRRQLSGGQMNVDGWNTLQTEVSLLSFPT